MKTTPLTIVTSINFFLMTSRLLTNFSLFAGNLITIGSIANLIVIESAREFGVNISFGEHAKAGVPITLFSLLIIILWLG